MFRKHCSKGIRIFIRTVMPAAIIYGMIFGSQLDFSHSSAKVSTQQGQQEIVPIPAIEIEEVAYELVINGSLIGTYDNKAKTAELIQTAKANIVKSIGYEPDYSYSVGVNEIVVEDGTISDVLELMTSLEEALYADIGEIMVKACILKIDDFTVSLASQEDLTTVLEGAQGLYVQDDNAIIVNLKKDSHNPLILTPEVSVLSKALPEERVFVTSKMTDAPMEDLNASEEQFLEAVVREVKLEQEIIVVEAFVFENEIVDVITATEMITQEHETKKMYTIKAGDVPSVIAEKNNMATAALYDLNPGLRENDRRMRIGDELVVMKPEPKLYVNTVEDVIFTEIINRDIVYVNDPNAYIGSYSVIEEGADGVIEIRATVEKLNGKIVNQEITEQTRVMEPVTETQYRGVKALPVTTATGTFEMPMLTYTFTSGYGYRWGRLHKGIDLAASTGTAIKASDGGRVIKAGWDGGYGYTIEIDHGKGLVSKYAHCSALYVGVGDEVSQYQTIAAVGNTGNSTGPHLHFEIRLWDTPKNPMGYITKK